MKNFLLIIFFIFSTTLYSQCQGDMNGDGIVNVIDIVAQVNFIMEGGECDECGDTVELFGQTYDVETTTQLYLCPDFQSLPNQSQIPPEIGCLVNLETLVAANCLIVGEIPAELGNLINLVELELENNHLEGGIPIELANLTNLQYFDLENNHLDGDIPQSVKDLIIYINSIDDSYVSLIENPLNETEWINENACGDCLEQCEVLDGTWVMDTYNWCGNGLEQADEGEYFIFDDTFDNRGGSYQQISGGIVDEEGWYDCQNGNIVHFVPSDFDPINNINQYDAVYSVTPNTLSLEILIDEDDCTEIILNFHRQE